MNQKKNETATLICEKSERYFEIASVIILLTLGVYQSIILFGHKVVPISDFSSFVKTGHEILALKIPTSFKLAPVTGILEILFGKILGGQYPDLMGGWLLNSVLHPLNLVLFWLIGKRIIGKTAVWFAVIASIIPWTLYMVREPLAETTLLFFVMFTIYLIYRRSRWAYLFASITTMVRYEGAALIMAAFVMDMINSENRKQRWFALFYSAIASVPLALWLVGTFLKMDTASANNYLAVFTKDYSKHFNESKSDRTGIVMHLQLIWFVGFKPLFMISPTSNKDSLELLFFVSKSIALISFIFGAVYGLVKRNWYILILLIFLVPYFLIHAFYPYPIPRFHATSFWIALLISLFGLRQVWTAVKTKLRLSATAGLFLSAIVLVAAFLLTLPLISYMPKLAQISSVVKWLPYIAISGVAALLLFRCFFEKFRFVLRDIAIATFMGFIIISNQFSLAPLLLDGKQDIEFKYLADWYIKNAAPDEKMAVYMGGTVKVFAPKFENSFAGFPAADSPQELAEKLRNENITYVVWATREGLSNDHYDYHRLNLDKNIAFLRNAKDIGPYKFVAQVKGERGYVNIFRLN